MIYKLYTEDKNVNKTKALIARFFNGFTLVNAIGYYKKTREKALIIEIISNTEIDKKIKSLANKIKALNKQKSILLIKSKENCIFI